MNEKHQMIEWVKSHKKQLIVTGIGIAALMALILGIKNRELLKALWASLKATAEPAAEIISESVSVNVSVKVTDTVIEKPTIRMRSDPRVPQEIRRHIRNLPEGWHASPEKIAAALKLNIILEEGQTWVENYTKGACAA